ncbi:RhoGEF domain containing protein [Trichomonas vaginalis G3]|uniref:RhoGEF domain containing protein n=1 Tax=Trichomonas vaginalis (strain ATCC PRA-98 / G3) TaxID=412133 RepID=A2F021_TRIV3|nr:Rho guanyl-nucleotide exchange factor protein [Trichomonas vaginalis G3]EAY01723.1 RhoGEF domain containing protein [Trichomonas vaginalis G3]KAI5532787.1 Rho guanyl-nucleotide exchange factor protein [Trichomonas vaginalis G3]|eukprot:XP_001314281.1 RhoGEF domain containing protein [Trichomonas vaginalis G3]
MEQIQVLLAKFQQILLSIFYAILRLLGIGAKKGESENKIAEPLIKTETECKEPKADVQKEETPADNSELQEAVVERTIDNADTPANENLELKTQECVAEEVVELSTKHSEAQAVEVTHVETAKQHVVEIKQEKTSITHVETKVHVEEKIHQKSETIISKEQKASASAVTVHTEGKIEPEPEKQPQKAENKKSETKLETPTEKPTTKPAETPASPKKESKEEKKTENKKSETKSEKPAEKPAPKPEEKPTPKPEEKPAPKAEEKPKSKPEEKTAPKAEEKPTPKVEEKPAPKVEEKPAPKAEEKPAPKAEEKPKSKPEEKPAPKVEEKPKSKVEEKTAPKAEEKPAPKAEEKPKSKAEEKPAPKVEEKPKSKVEEKPAPKAEENPAPKVEEKPAPKVEEKPAPKPAENKKPQTIFDTSVEQAATKPAEDSKSPSQNTRTPTLDLVAKRPEIEEFESDDEENNTKDNSSTSEQPSAPVRIFEEKMLKKREFAINELCSSEEVYCNYIRNLIVEYKPAVQHLINEDQTRLIFQNIDTLILLSNQFSSLFAAERKKGPQFALCGNCFTNAKHLIKMFVPYIEHYPEIDLSIKKLTAMNKKFRIACEAVVKKGVQPISSLVIMPVQRMPKYVLLLREIYKATPEWHEDRKLLEDAMASLKEASSAADAKTEEAKRKSDLYMLQSTIKDCQLTLVAPRRTIIARFPGQLERYEIVIMTDMIIVIKGHKKTALRSEYTTLKSYVMLSDNSVVACNNHVLNVSTPNRPEKLTMQMLPENEAKVMEIIKGVIDSIFVLKRRISIDSTSDSY